MTKVICHSMCLCSQTPKPLKCGTNVVVFAEYLLSGLETMLLHCICVLSAVNLGGGWTNLNVSTPFGPLEMMSVCLELRE